MDHRDVQLTRAISQGRSVDTWNRVRMNYMNLEAALLNYNLKDDPTNIFMCEKFVDVLVLGCCNASGYALPPMVLFNNSAGRRRSLNHKMMLGEIPGSLYAFCEGYSIKPDILQEWFSHHFLRFAPSLRPLLLLMEGSVTDIQDLADKESIVLFTKPTNLNPGPFTTFRSEWQKVVEEFAKSRGRDLNRYEFTPLFSQVWLNTMTIKTISTGFKESGVCPFNN